ncbi:cytochrome c peroxidase [Fluviicola sp.]|uniref:cytochrome-c peroxidase n=1 Tax=Fluviicola sp. TaxID=1917219 RepID=UPI0031E3FE7B
MKFNKNFFFSGLLVVSLGWKCSGPAEKPIVSRIPFPEENPVTAEKIAFGKRLFFDKRLSKNNEMSCSTCHRPEKAFTDGLSKSRGTNGSLAMRNASSLFNVAYSKSYMYDGEVKTLEQQALVPIQDHLEMGSSMKEVIRKLSKDPQYNQLAKQIFKRKLDAYVITRALSTYERTLISRNSRFDRYRKGEKHALNANETAGWKLFSEKLYCIQCHSGPDFTNYKVLCNGLYTDYGTDQGRYRINGLEEEKGAFKVPGLRNVSLTAPYMHDGSIPTLREVIVHYSRGGVAHPNKSALVKPFHLTDLEINQLESFLKTLIDTSAVK